MPMSLLLATTLLVAAPASTTDGLSDRWLRVDPFRSSATVVTTVYLWSGDPAHPAQPKQVKQSDLGRLEMRTPKGSDVMMDQLHADTAWLVRLDMQRLGLGDDTYLIALDENPVTLELKARDFQAYLRAQGLTDAEARRAKDGHVDSPGEVRHSEYMKSIFQRGSKPDDFVAMPVGQEFEIVTLQDPYKLRPGATLPVVLLFHGQPLPGRKVTATNLLKGRPGVHAVTTDSLGRASFVLDEAGEWLLRAAHIEPSKEPDVDWRSYKASLTFSLGK